MCGLAAPAVPHPLPSCAQGLTGLLLSVSSLLLPRLAAFSLLHQVHRAADLEELVEEEGTEKKLYFSSPSQGLSAPH